MFSRGVWGFLFGAFGSGFCLTLLRGRTYAALASFFCEFFIACSLFLLGMNWRFGLMWSTNYLSIFFNALELFFHQMFYLEGGLGCTELLL